jgi:hypothetical protein
LIFAGCKTVETKTPEKQKPEKKQTVNPSPQKVPKKQNKSNIVANASKKNSTKAAPNNSPEKPQNETVKKDLAATEGNLSQLVLPKEDASRFLSPDSFVVKWKILAPFKVDMDEAKTINDAIHHVFIPDEQNLAVNVMAPNETVWKYSKPDSKKPVGIVDLNKLFGSDKKNIVAYAVAVVRSPAELSNLNLYIGGSDFIKVWINGKLIHAYNKEPRKGDIDQDTVKGIKLEKGLNSIVMKIVKVSGEWSFSLRFATENNIPIRIEK